MNDFFEQYRPLYENTYTLEAWIIWASLYIQYFGYYICLYLGYFLVLSLSVLPFIGMFGLYYNIKIKIKRNKINKHKNKLKNQVEKEYISSLDNFTKKKKKKKH